MAGMDLPVGSLVALATPMRDDGAVDIAALRELLRWHKAEKTDGVVILGTTGEASCLSSEEKAEVMAVTNEEVGGVMPIIVGVGTISTSSTVAATKQARLFGADAVLVVTPYYVKPSQAGLQAHFTKIADASDLPLVLYNVPGRTGVDLSMETTVALSRHPMIQGLKDATGDNTRVSAMRAICGDDFRLYSGEDAMARDYVLQGGDGVISVTANVAPARVHSVMTAAKAGDVTAAEAADAPLAALHRDLFCEANPIPVKWALAKMGRAAEEGIRLPLVPLGVEYHGRVDAALKQGGCIESEDGAGAYGGSYGWPSRKVRIEGHLFDSGLINQALELIEKRGGDFEIESFSVQPNDQRFEFAFKRLSSVTLLVFGLDTAALDDITDRLKKLVFVMESAEGTLTELPEAAEV
jgi:4-hydroxy-tetrahydrodipicolinate synthase